MTDKSLVTISPQEAHDTVENIGVLMKEVTLRVFEIGALACKIVETKGWSYNWDSLNAFIADLGFGRKTFFNYVRLHRLWKNKISRVIDKADCIDIMLTTPYYKILCVATHLEKADTDDEIVQVLHNANKLSASDLAIAYGKAKPILRILDGKLYKLLDKGHGRYDITLSNCRVAVEADAQVWWNTFQANDGRVKATIEALNVEEME